MELIMVGLKDVIRDYIISRPFVYRGDRINEERMRALCQLYLERPDDFVHDVEILTRVTDFPFRSMWYRNNLRDEVVRCLAVTDFISTLTDDEVAMLSETVPQSFRI
jgi:dGTP triphosphohydrolase